MPAPPRPLGSMLKSIFELGVQVKSKNQKSTHHTNIENRGLGGITRRTSTYGPSVFIKCFLGEVGSLNHDCISTQEHRTPTFWPPSVGILGFRPSAQMACLLISLGISCCPQLLPKEHKEQLHFGPFLVDSLEVRSPLWAVCRDRKLCQ